MDCVFQSNEKYLKHSSKAVQDHTGVLEGPLCSMDSHLFRAREKRLNYPCITNIH
jgi:hypothetical protein